MQIIEVLIKPFIIPLVAILTTSYNSDNVIEKEEDIAPTILIVSHSEGAEVQEGFVEYFRATVSDDDSETMQFDDSALVQFSQEHVVLSWKTQFLRLWERSQRSMNL